MVVGDGIMMMTLLIPIGYNYCSFIQEIRGIVGGSIKATYILKIIGDIDIGLLKL